MKTLEPTDRAPPVEEERKAVRSSEASPEWAAKTPEELVRELQQCQMERAAQDEALATARLALQEAREQDRDFLDFAPIGCLTLTRETRIVEINTTGAAILGIEREQLPDNPFRHRVAPADLDSWDRYFASVLHDGDKQRCELRLKRTDGSTFPARLLGRRSQTRGGATQVRIALDDISERRHLEAALHQNEDTLNALPAHIAVLDANGRIVLVNEAWQRFAARNGGLDHQIGIGNDYLAVCRHAIARDRDATAQAALDGISAVLDGTRRDFSLEYPCDSPTVQRRFSMRAHALGRPRHGAVVVHDDITARKRVEAVLRWNEQRVNLALRSAHSGTWEWDIGTQATRWSTETYWMLGLEPGRLAPTHSAWLKAIHPEDRDRFQARVAEAIQRGEDLDLEYRVVWPDGGVRWLYARGQLVFDENGRPARMMGILMDVTDRKQAEEDLRIALEEKTVLLHEVHHRVKNNLAAIIDLLELQRESVPDASTSAQLTELGHRIHAMALVHKMLYQSGSLSRVDCHGYLQALVAHLRDSLDPDSAIRLRVAVPGIEMNLDTAIPCGLIVNELVTNALQHAFPGRRPRPGADACEIVIAADWDGATYTLAVTDNGVGLPAGLDWTTTSTLGLRLVRMLGQHQLRGQLEFDGVRGTRCSLRFGAKRDEGMNRHQE